MATLTQMLGGMKRFFLAKEVIASKIGTRLYDTIAEQRIAALEDPNGERSPRTQQFAEYADAGEVVNRLKGAESAAVFTDVEFRCYAWLPGDARRLLELFMEQFPENSYSGTWTDDQGVDVTIQHANWNRATRNTDYDDTARMSVSSCTCTVRWLQR